MSGDKSAPVVFDAFGTLFDVTALGDLMSQHVANAESVAASWRGLQLQYSFIRSMTGRYEDFDQVTRDALHKALLINNVEPTGQVRERLAHLWTELPLYPDARATLEAFSDRTRAILSNGTLETVTSLLRNAGIDEHVDMVLSADSMARYKPDSAVYEMVPAALGVRRRSIHFVTANAFDVAGAKAAGFTVYWVNRDGLEFDRVGWEPDVTVPELSRLTGLID